MACLRGGRDEVDPRGRRLAVERGLLAADGDNLRTTAEDAADKARRPLDKAILTKFAKPGKGQSLYSDKVVLGEADAVAATLKEKGSCPTSKSRNTRAVTAIAAVGLLWMVAGMKIAVALSRGRHNILFLLSDGGRRCDCRGAADQAAPHGPGEYGPSPTFDEQFCRARRSARVASIGRQDGGDRLLGGGLRDGGTARGSGADFPAAAPAPAEARLKRLELGIKLFWFFLRRRWRRVWRWRMWGRMRRVWRLTA